MAFRMNPSATSGGARGGNSAGDNRRQGKALTDRLYKLFLSLLEVAPYLLIPTTFKYYEVFAEGCHSLSQLLPYVTHLIISGSNEFDSLVGMTKLEYFLRITTRVINCIEVFVEKVAVCFISQDKNMEIVRMDPNYTMLIVLIEGLKALCRLLILHDRKKATMLIHWGSGSVSSGDIKDLIHYREFYRVDLHTFRANPSSKSSFMNEKVASKSTEETSSMDQEAKVYRGSRSGINIPLTNGQGRSFTSQRNFTNTSQSDNERNNSITNNYPFSAEQLFALGEVLYVMRPAVYAWVLHYVAKKRNNTPQRSENSEEKIGADNTSSSQEFTINITTIEKFMALAISLSIELISLQLTARALQMCRDDASTATGSNSDTRNRGRKNSHAFDQELTRRKSNLAYYLIKSPLFDKATLPILQQAANLLVHVPLINSLPKYAIDILQYYNRCHFYTSNS
jgi:hypothetical protein